MLPSLFQSLGVVHRVVQYRRSADIFAQGAECAKVIHLVQRSVKVSVLSPARKEAIVSVLQPGLRAADPTLLSLVLHS